MSGDLISCVWDGRAFTPATPFHHRRAEAAFGEGEIVLLNVENESSGKSRRHYFACLREAWQNLPESVAMETWAQSTEHLRKYALIRTGFSESQTLIASSAAEASRFAAFLRPTDEFSIVLARGVEVIRFTAKSQRVKAMGAKEFQRSKVEVLEFVAGLIGTTSDQLGSAA